MTIFAELNESYMKHIIVLFIALMSCLCLNAEVRIQMEKEAGVYKVPCKENRDGSFDVKTAWGSV